MSNINHNILKSILRYLPIVLGNLLLVSYFFYVYLTDSEVYFVFTLIMMFVWFVFNVLCIIMMTIISSKEGDIYKPAIDNNKHLTMKNNKIRGVFKFILPKIKYLAIAYVNYLFISTMVGWYIDSRFFSITAFIVFLIYNLFCFTFIKLLSKARQKEFYSFIMIVLPVIIGLVWYIIV